MLLLGSVALVQRLATRLTRAPWVGLAAAGLYALHPTTATAICWLSTANLALALVLLLGYLRCVEHGWSGGALVALALGLLAHELAVVAPLLGWAYLRALDRPRPSLRTPWAAGSLVLVGAYAAAQLLRGVPSHAYRGDAWGWSASFSASRYFVTHLGIWLWPRDRFGVLLGDQPAQHLAASAASWIVVLAAAVLAWRRRGRDRTLDFALAWVVLTLLPVCNLVPFGNTPIALHYLLLPAPGLALALARGLALLIGRLSQRRAVAALALALLLAALRVPETVHAVAAWRDEEQLYLATLDSHPDEVEVLSNLGSYYLGVRRYADARPWLARAYALAPGDEGVLINAYALAMQTDRPADALALLDAHPAREAQPGFAIRRGEALERLGRDAEAAAAFERGYRAAGRVGPPESRFIAGYRWMVALVRLGREPEAEALLARLLAEFPAREELHTARRLFEEQ